MEPQFKHDPAFDHYDRDFIKRGDEPLKAGLLHSDTFQRQDVGSFHLSGLWGEAEDGETTGRMKGGGGSGRAGNMDNTLTLGSASLTFWSQLAVASHLIAKSLYPLPHTKKRVGTSSKTTLNSSCSALAPSCPLTS